MHAAERLDRVTEIVVRVRGRERQREHLRTGALGLGKRRLPGREAVAVGGEPVHGQEVDRAADVLLRKCTLVVVARRARAIGVDADDVEVEGVRVGKYLELRLAAESAEAAAERVRGMCQKLLANPVIEDFRFELAEAEG